MQNDKPTQNPQPAQVINNTSPGRSSLRVEKMLGLIVAGAALFVFGLFVGQGKIQLFTSFGQDNTAKVTSKLDYSQLDELYRTLKGNYDGKLTDSQIIEGLKHGMAKSTADPYTEYMSASEAEDFQGSLQGTFSGVGAQLGVDDDGNVVIVAPLVGSPAEAAGLRAKDIIFAINKEPAYGLTTSEAVKKIRGEKGSKVELTIIRDKTKRLDFVITRDTIKVPSVVAKTLENGSIGYLQVSQFSDDTDELVEAEIAKFGGVKKIILDLRDNPGGEVTTAVNLSSLWLQPGDKIVEQRKGKDVTDTNVATAVNTLRGTDTVVLLNGGSASASEITALALRDHNAARIIGETSYGKGVVQQLFPFSDGSSLKVTVAKWYSPNGTNIDKKGIKPDQEVKMTDADYESNTDVQLNAAVDYLKKK